KNQVVNRHNAYRRSYGASPLSWGDELCADTLQRARQCRFYHRKLKCTHGNDHYEENLAAGTPTVSRFEGLNRQGSKVAKYDYNHPDLSSSPGHFT
ncbi:hypothetical protein NEOLEDRAFT_1077750, partial [Neolentinus lepideus HHB14362 ss-1]